MTGLRRFAANAAVLTATSLSVGAAGVIFGAWLTRNLGEEGMGLYGLMMAVYRFAVTLASAGAGLVATALVAQEEAKSDPAGETEAMEKTVLYGAFFGLAAMALLWSLSDFAARALVGDARAAMPLRVLSWSLPFVSLSGALSGWFTAVRRLVPSSLAMIFEQLSQMAFTTAVFAVIRPSDLGTACVLAAAGSTASEMMSFFLFLALYIGDRRRHPAAALPGRGVKRDMTGRVLRIGLPVAASNCLRSALSTVKHLMVPVSLQKSGLTAPQALAEYGLVGQMVLPVLLFPCAFLLGFSNLMVPEMARYREKRMYAAIRRAIEYVFRLTLMFAIWVAAALVAFGGELGKVLYGSAEAGAYIRALAPVVTVMYLDSAVDGILKGLGQQVAVVRYNVYDTALCVLAVWLLVPVAGVPGYMGVVVCSEVFNMTLSAGRLIAVVDFRVDMVRWALLPAVAAALAFGAAKAAAACLPGENAAVLAGAGLFAAAAYFALLLLMRCIKKKDLELAAGVFRRQPL